MKTILLIIILFTAPVVVPVTSFAQYMGECKFIRL